MKIARSITGTYPGTSFAPIEKKVLQEASHRKKKDIHCEVPQGLELGSLDSKSRVLTITPWDHR